jgi:hypothetical protein
MTTLLRILILSLLCSVGGCDAARSPGDEPVSTIESPLTTVRALHVHVTGPTGAADHETVTVGVQIIVGFSDDDYLTDSFFPELELKTVLGLYKTAIQMNADVAEEVKDFLYSSYSIPTNGYAAVYVSGAYGLLNLL